MTREQLFAYIAREYGVEPDYPFADDNVSAVFRHPENQKWFALVMRVAGEKIGSPPGAFVEILNCKCDPLLIGSLRLDPGFRPAYHMSKAHWITAVLEPSGPACPPCQDEDFEQERNISLQALSHGKQRAPSCPARSLAKAQFAPEDAILSILQWSFAATAPASGKKRRGP